MKSLFVAAILAATTVAAHAQQPGPRAPSAWKFDASGWTLLGTQGVDGRKDRDTIVVGRYEGKFDELTIVVNDSDLQLEDFTVVFANGEKFSPKLKHGFKEGQRSRAIDLPGNDRTIAKIEMLYKNTPGGGKATVSVYGRDRRAKPASPAAFDARGWTLLGSQTVNGRRDRDVIRVGRYAGKLDQLTMVVSDSDLELKDLTIQFSNGQKWSPKLAHTFREGARTRAIDLPGKDRTISRIDLAYANLPGGGKAKVELYGRDLKRPEPPPITPVVWESKGWTMIGKSTVDGWRDRDTLTVRSAVPFSELMFVVAGSDVELNYIIVTFGNNEKLELPAKVVFKEGTRTAPLDLPGKLRKIKTVQFAYANLPGGGRASLEVWARAKPGAQPTPPNPADQRAKPDPNAPPIVRDHR